MAKFWSLAVDAPLMELLTYQCPEELEPLVKRGGLVEVPLGKRKALGLLIQECETPPENIKIKSILNVQSDYEPLPANFLKWLEWVGQYYVHPLGSIFGSSFPPLKKQTKERKSSRDPVVKQVERTAPPQLTSEQQKVVEDIVNVSGFSTHLLFGVTGSGKTEVYLQVLERTLAQGQQGLVLVPEISLTPQLVQRFAARFGDQISVLHSQLTDRERTNQWWDIIQGKKRILIGARSALFCPLDNLGIIIVDEEHEPSFKQEEKLKYHGRDCAIMLAKFSNCPIVLGSATPSLETWKNAIEGKYHLHEMRARVENRSLPEVHIVDMREEKDNRRDPEKMNALNTSLPTWLSPTLYQAMVQTYEKKEQSALFLNRRGVAPVIFCPDCGYTYECPNCDISLTLHGQSHLVCHYCDYHENLKQKCPDCKEGEPIPLGLGTESLEKEIQNLFPNAKIARADRDEIQTRADLEDLVEKMEIGEIDILIGTQMIAKGLDFKNLTLVGLVLADVGFNLPDFRATERSFQLITQVSGRAGRHVKPGEQPGQVIVQTYNIDHPSLVYAQKNDFRGFAEQELEHRKFLHYPPFGRLIGIRIQGTQLANVETASDMLAKRAHSLKKQQEAFASVEILGPAQAPLAKLRGQFRYHLLFKGPDPRLLNRFCRMVFGDQQWTPPGVRLSADIDPLHLL